MLHAPKVHPSSLCLSTSPPTTRTSSMKMGEQGDSWQAHQERGAKIPVLQDYTRVEPLRLHSCTPPSSAASETGFQASTGLGRFRQPLFLKHERNALWDS